MWKKFHRKFKFYILVGMWNSQLLKWKNGTGETHENQYELVLIEQNQKKNKYFSVILYIYVSSHVIG